MAALFQLILQNTHIPEMAILNSFRALVLLSVAVVLVWYNGIDPMSFIERRTPANCKSDQAYDHIGLPF